MSETEAIVEKTTRFSLVWLIPIVAAVLGIWMVIYDLTNRGPEISIRFSTGEGIEAGKTKIRSRNVDIGTIVNVSLADDLESVILEAELSEQAERLLREDTQFWVVRPRVGVGGISGLGTILSGAYVELVTGEGVPTGRRFFEGLDEVPITAAGSPGIRVSLISQLTKSLSVGDAVTYRGFTVGRVESATVDLDGQNIRYSLFVDAPYDRFVTRATRFWDAGGVAVNTSTEGIDVRIDSLVSLIAGGVAFDLPVGEQEGEPARSGDEFNLFSDYRSINENPHRHGVEYVVLINQNVKGLNAGAPVEFRGIRVGSVVRIMLDEYVALPAVGDGSAIPVIVRLLPGLFRMGDSPEGVERLVEAVESSVESGGLRAALASGNILTGQRFVALDLYPDAQPEKAGRYAGFATIPTTTSGLDHLGAQVASLLEKLNALPLEPVLASSDSAIRQMEKTLSSTELAIAQIADTVKSAEIRRLVATADRTLAQYGAESAFQTDLTLLLGQLNQTLIALQSLSSTLEQQPSALLFPKEPATDVIPKAQ